ncbi:hypothetical protein NRIC_11640 [Enterococcus florum]|uniref:Uncharacterized protein n=1 Tax=Enterococcus florum TaxID=2480627 RepID=A0A4P5PIT6_9ENTE|nr:hypothetical protein [Enterococcus florum]GCF93273.1 hypothetical protein NRIC_11640 [Enterococcus florum]
MNDFQREFPNTAKSLRQRFPEKAPLSSLWHWLLLGFFSLLAVASLQNQLLLIGGMLLLAALVKGPGMIIWGIAYSFLVSLFPPIGILLSAIFFLLNIRLLTHSWRVNLISTLVYLYPLGLSGLRYFTDWTATWQTALLLLPGLLILHLSLTKVYTFYPSARQVVWTILATPFELLILVLPKRFSRKFKQTPDFNTAVKQPKIKRRKR